MSASVAAKDAEIKELKNKLKAEGIAHQACRDTRDAKTGRIDDLENHLDTVGSAHVAIRTLQERRYRENMALKREVNAKDSKKQLVEALEEQVKTKQRMVEMQDNEIRALEEKVEDLEVKNDVLEARNERLRTKHGNLKGVHQELDTQHNRVIECLQNSWDAGDMLVDALKYRTKEALEVIPLNSENASDYSGVDDFRLVVADCCVAYATYMKSLDEHGMIPGGMDTKMDLTEARKILRVDEWYEEAEDENKEGSDEDQGTAQSKGDECNLADGGVEFTSETLAREDHSD